jgi:hypothetical protein
LDTDRVLFPIGGFVLFSLDVRLPRENVFHSYEQECVMKSFRMIFLAGVLSALLSPAVHAQGGSATAPILVDDDKVECPTAAFTKIQAAIDAASPRETIRVCRGRYHEQLTIDKSITLAADNEVILSPTGMTANATGLTQSARGEKRSRRAQPDNAKR